jgi:cyclin B
MSKINGPRKFGDTLQVQVQDNNRAKRARPVEPTAGYKKAKSGDENLLLSVNGQENSVVDFKKKKNECEEIDLSKSIVRNVRNLTVKSSSDLEDQCSLGSTTSSPVKPAALERLKAIDFSDPITYYQAPAGIPSYVEDFDQTQVHDHSSEPHYAQDIFNYYKKQEVTHKVVKYMNNQTEVNRTMRAVLVDWLVEVQESFELNHETLYLAVKLVDHYQMVKSIKKQNFQLLGATCMLIASKFDERIPPAIEDFLYICDDAYDRHDLILMEIEVLQKLNFFIGFPISYRFLRRYARCSKLSMETLTLARYILEMSLMEYELIEERDSKVAAAALMLALQMKKKGSWTTSLEFYSGYEEMELIPLMSKLNDLISGPIKPAVKTIKTKYSHKIFFEVAKVAPLPKKSD